MNIRFGGSGCGDGGGGSSSSSRTIINVSCAYGVTDWKPSLEVFLNNSVHLSEEQ